MARITTPVPGYSGQGPAGVMFQDGVGESDDPAVIAYCRGAGYGIDGEPPERETPEVPDPREVTTTVVGAPARDAAVDPRPGDFRPPVGAGEANPHGPEVYAPGLPGGGLQPTAPAAPAPEGQQDGQSSIGRPPQSEPVAAWREYAAGVATSDEERAEVDKMTKAELIKRYGG